MLIIPGICSDLGKLRKSRRMFEMAIGKYSLLSAPFAVHGQHDKTGLNLDVLDDFTPT